MLVAIAIAGWLLAIAGWWRAWVTAKRLVVSKADADMLTSSCDRMSKLIRDQMNSIRELRQSAFQGSPVRDAKGRFTAKGK